MNWTAVYTFSILGLPFALAVGWASMYARPWGAIAAGFVVFAIGLSLPSPINWALVGAGVAR